MQSTLSPLAGISRERLILLASAERALYRDRNPQSAVEASS